MFVMLAHNGRILPHSVDHARAWQAAGYSVTVIVIVPSLSCAVDISRLDFAWAVLIRLNRGYDFGAWAAGIVRLKKYIRTSVMIAIANDSLLGPSAEFAAMLARVEATRADLVGLTESNELRPHVQSFVLFFKRRAIRSAAFWSFWENIRSGDRNDVIANCEVPLRSHFDAAGLTTVALFGNLNKEQGNATLMNWRELLAAKFPYFKVALLRDNPHADDLSDWKRQALTHGFDVTRLTAQINALKAISDLHWAI